MRVLITGVTGFVGTHLAKTLESRGHEVAGTYFGAEPRVGGRHYSVDLREPSAIQDAVVDFSPERIVHLAGASHVGTSWNSIAAYYSLNVLGTEHVLDAAGEIPVLLASSAEVYGLVPQSEQPILETRPPAPANPYALTKAAAERLVIRQNGLVVRLFNMIGAGQAETFALPTFARQLRAIESGEISPVLRVGNLEPRRDFVHVEDGAEALAFLVESGGRGRIYQVASGEAHSVGEVLDLLCRVSGVDARIEVDPERFRPQDMILLVGSGRCVAELGWSPSRSVEDAVRDLWRSLASWEV